MKRFNDFTKANIEEAIRLEVFNLFGRDSAIFNWTASEDNESEYCVFEMAIPISEIGPMAMVIEKLTVSVRVNYNFKKEIFEIEYVFNYEHPFFGGRNGKTLRLVYDKDSKIISKYC